MYFPPPQYDISMGVAESRKYVDVSGKWSHYFTLTPFKGTIFDDAC
jgi:hypothetical protein